MHQIIILAGGGARRGWTIARHKVMAEVEGKPIVMRVVEQVQCNCVVLTENANVVRAIGEEIPCYVPPPYPAEMAWHYKRPIGGLANSIPLWSQDERTILLCGDVVYPPKVLKAILEDTAPIRIWGTYAEIVGITFASGEYHRMEQAVWDALHSNSRHAHLWVLYRVLCGLNVNRHTFGVEDNVFKRHTFRDDEIFKLISDDAGIIDFDSVEKYEKWLRKNPWAKRVVYISGCWDLFHVGHLWALQHARAVGDVLVVGVNTDEFIRSYKPAAPVCSYEQRCAILRALPCVDAIVPHGSIKDTTGFEEHGVNVRAFGPDYADPYKNVVQPSRTAEEREVLLELQQAGIEAYHIPWAPGDVSTTKIKEKVKCLLQHRDG